ncbi:MAG: YndJ family transporter [Chloroflexota bacterium]
MAGAGGAARGLGPLRHAIAGLPAVLGRERAADLATDAALVGLAVGAGWLWVDRTGIVVPGIAPLIGTLTAVHFHMAAFGLVSAPARRGSARSCCLAGVGRAHRGHLAHRGGVRAAAVPRDLGWARCWSAPAGCSWQGCWSGDLAGWWSRTACLGLAVGMVLAIAWPTSLALAPGMLDIDLMVRTHGVLNATAVTLLAWTARTWMGDAR